jgi:hypothetical protein
LNRSPGTCCETATVSSALSFARMWKPWDQRSSVGATLAVAASLRGARHRHDSPRVPRPHDRSQRGFIVPAHEVLPGVLSRIQDSPLAGQGRAGTSACALGGSRPPSLPFLKLAGFPTATSAAQLKRSSLRPNSYFGSVPMLVCPARARPLPGRQSHRWISRARPIAPAETWIEISGLWLYAGSRLQIGFAVCSMRRKDQNGITQSSLARV